MSDTLRHILLRIASNVSELRARNRLSVDELARRAGLPAERVRLIEEAALDTVMTDDVAVLADALQVDAYEIVRKRTDVKN